ncbi:hypothetical protein LLG46_06335 [bacterium]|nr:hypothetical protein [bacterium]
MMVRYSLLFVMVAVLIVMSTGASLAVFPKPDGYMDVEMQRGWYNNQLAWFVPCETNSISFAWSYDLDLSKKLSSLIGNANAYMYIFTNSSQNPVFSAAPGGTYSGIWQIVYVEWITTPWVVMNSDDYDENTNPHGMPLDGVQADLTPSDTVIDAPIVATGPLGGKWVSTGSKYRIKQAQVLPNYAYTKIIMLPYWYTYAQDDFTGYVSQVLVFITDAASSTVANLVGANVAPLLAAADVANTQNFWSVNPLKPPYQYPVISEAPVYDDVNWFNTNDDYSPVNIYQAVVRGTLPYSATVTTDDYLVYLLGTGGLVTSGSASNINAHVLTDID